MNKELLKVFFKPLTWWNKISKKNDNLIFFYTNLGFRDNVKALYDYMIKEEFNKVYRIVVSADDYERYADTAPRGVKFVSNKEGIKYFLKCKYAFYCFGKYPIKPAKSQTVVNLWHGTPIKCLGNLEEGKEEIDYHYFTNVVTASSMYIPIMADIFGCDESEVDVLGYPRNDALLQPDKELDQAIRRGCNKMFAWLPTYREYDEDFFVPILNEDDMEDLNRILKFHNNRMIIKLHPLQQVDIAGINYSNIEVITEDQLSQAGITVYDILRNADALISDYSSVYFDYMILNRQIGFTITDIGEYDKKRGFIFDYPTDYMPGPTLDCKEDFVKFINGVEFGVDSYRNKRFEVNNIMNDYQDGNSAKRIVQHYIK